MIRILGRVLQKLSCSQKYYCNKSIRKLERDYRMLHIKVAEITHQSYIVNINEYGLRALLEWASIDSDQFKEIWDGQNISAP